MALKQLLLPPQGKHRAIPGCGKRLARPDGKGVSRTDAELFQLDSETARTVRDCLPPELLEGYKRRRLVFLILFITLYVITLLIAVWWALDFVRLMAEAPLYY